MSRYYLISTTLLVLFIGSMSIDGVVAIPSWWYWLLMFFFVAAAVLGSSMLSLQYYTPVISRGKNNGIALTFDDGPVPGKTDAVLDILKERNIKAAFFCIGNRIQAHPAIVRRIIEEGHVIGNHSFTHTPAFDWKSASLVTKELTDTNRVIQELTGHKPRYFRPPYGVTNPMIATAVKRLNLKTVGWSLRSLDTISKNPENLLRRITESAKPGDVILLHEHAPWTISILPRLLDQFQKSGLKVVRIDELINERPYA